MTEITELNAPSLLLREQSPEQGGLSAHFKGIKNTQNLFNASRNHFEKCVAERSVAGRLRLANTMP